MDGLVHAFFGENLLSCLERQKTCSFAFYPGSPIPLSNEKPIVWRKVKKKAYSNGNKSNAFAILKEYVWCRHN